MPLSGHTSGESVIGVTVAFTIVAALTVALRLWARTAVSRNAGWDDILITFALLFTIATTITMIIQVWTGMSRHQDTISKAEALTMMKAFYISIWVYNLSLSCSKLSILLQYLRIFPQQRFRVACYTLLGIVVVYSFYTFFTAVFACTPIAYFWNSSIDGHCLNRFAVWFANAGINIVTDISTGILPLPMLKQLELPSRQRRALMIVFALGGFTCIVSILRLQSLYAISKSTDVSWDNPMAAIWSSVEINTAILCSCLPTLRCVFPHLLRTHTGSLSRDDDSRSTPRFFPSSKIVSSVSAAGPPKGREATVVENVSRYQRHKRQKSSHRLCKRQERGLDEIEMDRPLASGVHVTTTIEQAVERKDGDDSSSTRELMRKKDVFDVV